MAKKAKRSCRFNDDFLKEEEYIPWLERSKNAQIFYILKIHLKKSYILIKSYIFVSIFKKGNASLYFII